MTVLYEVLEGRATITIDDPDRHNPMSVETMAGLAEATGSPRNKSCGLRGMRLGGA